MAVPASSAMSERVFSDCGLNVTSKRSRLGAGRVEQLTIISKNSDRMDQLLVDGFIDKKELKAMGNVANAFKAVKTFTEERGPEEFDLEDREISEMFASNTLEDMFFNSSDEEDMND